MVFYLKIQPSDQPGEKPASWRIIAGSSQLVYGPAIGNQPVFIRKGKRSAGHYMSSLKDGTDAKSGYKMHDDKCQDDNPGCERHHDQWQYQRIGIIQQFPAYQFKQLVSVFILSTEKAFILISFQSDKIFGSHPG